MPSAIESRDERICSRYLAEGLSAERLALDEGLSAARVKQILREGKATGKPRIKPVEGADKTVSAAHVKIGKVLAHHRMITMGVDRAHFAAKIQWSHVKVAYVEAGTYNLTLIDLQDIARTTGIGLPILLEDSTPVAEVLPNDPEGDSTQKDSMT